MATNFNKIAKDFVVPFWQDVINNLKTNLLKAGISGGSNIVRDLAQSLEFKIKKNGYIISLFMPDYYIFLDEGVGGNRQFGKNAKNRSVKKNSGRFVFKEKMPPIGPIRNFMRARGIVGRTRRGQRGSQSGRKALDSLAFAIAKIIQQRGLEQTNFYSDEVNDALIAQFQSGLADVIGEDLIINIEIVQ